MIVKGKKSAQLKALDEKGAGSAIIATLGVVDKDGDITLPGAFGSGQQAKMVPAHDWMHVPLGKATIREDGNEVIADFQMNLDITAGKEWHSALKFDLDNGKPIQEWSYGFAVLDSGQGEEGNQRVRILKSLKVYEISPVMLGAGEGTRTLSMKNHGGTLSDQIKESIAIAKAAIERCKEVKALRIADGRDISSERLEELKELHDTLREMQTHLHELGIEGEPSEKGASVEEILLAESLHQEFKTVIKK